MSVAAVILAAGFGTRLSPLTDHTPKPLLRVGDMPVASHLLGRLRELRDLSEVIVVVNELHLDQWHAWQANCPRTPDVQIVSNGVRSNKSRLGAVADLHRGTTHLASADWVVVVAGDNLLDEPLQPHVDAARAAATPVVLCRNLGGHVPPGRFGEIVVDAHGIITRFREKPDSPESPLVATCSYVLPARAVDAVADFLAANGDADSPGMFVDWLARSQPVLARPITGRYFDIGNLETLTLAREAYG